MSEPNSNPELAKSLLAGLAQENPDAEDARFLARAHALTDEDKNEIPGAGEDTDDDDDEEASASASATPDPLAHPVETPASPPKPSVKKSRRKKKS